MEAHEAKKNLKRQMSIICDGGVSNAGDCVKGLAAGADAIMTGRLFAGTDECPPPKIYLQDGCKKEYRGMSSKSIQLSIKDSNKISIEGVSGLVDCVGPLEPVLCGIINNVLSGFSYQDARSIAELQEHAEFIKISSAGMYESRPRK